MIPFISTTPSSDVSEFFMVLDTQLFLWSFNRRNDIADNPNLRIRRVLAKRLGLD